jgi:broad specificity phosphatase PhoE
VAARVGAPDRVISSPLRRAVETAECFGLPVEVDERWIELDYGTLEAVPLREVEPELWRRWRADPHFVPGGGESLVDLGLRVRAACAELAAEAARSDLVVVSHVSPIKTAVAWALDVGDEISWRLHLDTASVTRIAVRAGGPSLLSWNEVR